MIIKGKLSTLKREIKDFDGRKTDNLLFVSLRDVELSDDQIKILEDCFKDNGKKFTPDWVKNFKGYVNLKTKYELPCRDLDGNEFVSVEDFICDTNFAWYNADVEISVNTKDGAVYPKAIVFKSTGTAINAFAEFDNDSED